MRVCVTGGRDYIDEQFVWWVLGQLAPDITHIAVGDCPTGVDKYVRNWAAACPHSWRKPLAVYEADWSGQGRRAGPARNWRMLETEKPDILLALPGGRGTADCCSKAAALGVVVLRPVR